MLTVCERRQLAGELMATHKVSERRACCVLGHNRRSHRRKLQRREDEAKLTEAMLALVSKYPRYGYRRIWAKLVRAGWKVNRKRIYRLWKANGLKVPVRRRKRRRVGQSQNACDKKRSRGKDDVWAWDFIQDSTTKGVKLRWLSVIDEYTRECVALEVATSMGAGKVAEVLARVVQERGYPGHIRSDNGPEFIAVQIRDWLAREGVSGLYVEPGSPWENGFAESFHSKVRDELLSVEQFTSVTEARVLTAAWREEYNKERPHESLGYETPAEYSAKCERHDCAKPASCSSHNGSG